MMKGEEVLVLVLVLLLLAIMITLPQDMNVVTNELTTYHLEVTLLMTGTTTGMIGYPTNGATREAATRGVDLIHLHHHLRHVIVTTRGKGSTLITNYLIIFQRSSSISRLS